MNLILHDFTNETFKIGGITDSMISGNVITYATSSYDRTITLTAYDVNGDLLDGDWYIGEGGFLANTAVPVPEPATFAAVLGALAVAFAAYRRRK